MSFILDALRRADAERQRGQTPALQQVTQPAALTETTTGRRVWMALLVGAGLALAGGLVWWSFGRTPAVATAPVVAAVVAPAAPALVPAPAASPAPAPAPAIQPAPAAIPRAATATPSALPRRPATAAVVAPASVLASAPPARVPAVAASAPAPRPIPASALPEPQRSAVARLTIGGAVHSQDRGQSFVLVGGQLVREGETLAPGITLERITPRTLQLRVGEQLVEVPL